MAITKEQKNEFNENLADFKVYLDDLKKETSLYKSQQKKNKNLEPYYNIALAIDSVKLINTCILINEMSVSIMGLKNENYLGIARKEIYNIFSYMEKVVGSDFDGSLSENKDLLALIEEYNPVQRLNLIKAVQEIIFKMIDAFGTGSKWKWSWPEIHFKLAVLAKNLMDFRAMEAENDLENPYYHTRKEHFNMIVELANFAAQEYRTKFDLSTQDVGDLKKSVSLLEMNRKIFQITGETDDLEKTKTLIESLKEKIELIEAEKEKKKKK